MSFRRVQRELLSCFRWFTGDDLLVEGYILPAVAERAVVRTTSPPPPQSLNPNYDENAASCPHRPCALLHHAIHNLSHTPSTPTSYNITLHINLHYIHPSIISILPQRSRPQPLAAACRSTARPSTTRPGSRPDRPDHPAAPRPPGPDPAPLTPRSTTRPPRPAPLASTPASPPAPSPRPRAAPLTSTSAPSGGASAATPA
eukprot:1185774-Prorocentrum_minimum.AAC.7